MMKIKICLLIGLPAAGKTTLANHLKSYYKNHHKNIHILEISYDALIPQDINNTSQSNNDACPRSNQEMLDTSWKGYRNNIFQFIQEIICYIRGSENSLHRDYVNHLDGFCACFTQRHSIICHDIQHLILVDDNMFYHSMRYCFYQLACKFECSFCQIYLECELGMLLERNNSRNCKTVTEDTILKMADVIEKPDKGKHTWEENSLTFLSMNNYSENDLETLIEFINQHTNHLIPIINNELTNKLKEVDRKICLNSFLHQSDQLLRKVISKRMGNEKLVNADKKMLQNLGKMLNGRRKSYLDTLKESTLIDVHAEDGLLSEEVKNKIITNFNEYISCVSGSSES